MPIELNVHDFHGFDTHVKLSAKQSILERILIEAIMTRLDVSDIEDHGFSLSEMCHRYEETAPRTVHIHDDCILEAVSKEAFINKERINKAMSNIVTQTITVTYDDNDVDILSIFESFEYENTFTFSPKIVPYVLFLLNQCELSF